MNEGSVVLTRLPQADGGAKNRPALLLRRLPPFGDWLACGISTQIRQAVPDFDELITKNNTDFSTSGLLADSVIRLGFLAVLPSEAIMGSIGQISDERHVRLLRNLSAHLLGALSKPRD